MRVASHVVDVAGEVDAVVRSVDVSPDPRALDGASTGYPEVVVMVDDPGHRSRLAGRLALSHRSAFRVPVSDPSPAGVETFVGDFQGVRVQVVGPLVAGVPVPVAVAS